MFLITPAKLYSDEALESFLIRLCEVNGFESFQLLSGAMRDYLIDTDHQAAGALPRELCQINLYHAKHSSGFRMRAFELLDSLFDSDARPLVKQALLRSAVTFSPNLSSVFRNGIHVPLCFARDGYTPVCSKCLQESPYIRQYWQFQPYQACHSHGIDLLFNCPSCQVALDYQKSEQITHCVCGFDLRDASPREASADNIALSRLVAEGEKLDVQSITSWLGALLWFTRNYKGMIAESECGEPDFSRAVEYFASWPHSLEKELKEVADGAELKLVKAFNHSDFSEVFGDLVSSARKLPSSDLRQNFILKAIIEFLHELVHDNPKSKVANIGDLKLTVPETAALLTTSTEQVYRLYEEGYLQSSIRFKLHSKLSPNDAVFFLRHVIELRASGMASDYSTNEVYLPSW
ncbi:TniQ family protein [Photobacterium sp. ZSDE20]|uniref:TniQ family protein n=1 Tax=Photobacterium pectinilyticum TaxID=2906793 RepID=A0ABT1N4A5_9GAMM|nr:TniQ family protein [Photobacterium sp. ZSDE20]MCQ1059566.1 TniQ family protein [Photobacterium sp. ZSDE20]MDD1825429.1 TniQ family protein [Photobacterium sp. ZSDE20]